MVASRTLADQGKTPRDWVGNLFHIFDSLDIEQLSETFAPDVEVRFANQPPAVGHATALAQIAAFWSTIAGMRHERLQLFEDGNAAVQLSTVTYTRLDGLQLTLPVASHLRRDHDGKLDRLWVYIDLLPLFAEPPAEQ